MKTSKRIKKLITNLCTTVGHDIDKGACLRCGKNPDSYTINFTGYQLLGFAIHNPKGVLQVTCV